MLIRHNNAVSVGILVTVATHLASAGECCPELPAEPQANLTFQEGRYVDRRNAEGT
jgi:hypothetical protein